MLNLFLYRQDSLFAIFASDEKQKGLNVFLMGTQRAWRHFNDIQEISVKGTDCFVTTFKCDIGNGNIGCLNKKNGIIDTAFVDIINKRAAEQIFKSSRQVTVIITELCGQRF